MNHFVVGILLFLGTPRASVIPLHPESPNMTLEVDQQRRETQFSWAGSVQVRCTNGECKLVSSNGFVFALDSATAKIRAEANLRAEAGRQGVAVEGSFSVTVRAEFVIEPEGGATAMTLDVGTVQDPALATGERVAEDATRFVNWTWDGNGYIFKNNGSRPVEVTVKQIGNIIQVSFRLDPGQSRMATVFGTPLKSFEKYWAKYL